MARGLDHIVVAVQDLDAVAEKWKALGFTVTPENRHPWGTANRLIQLDGFFIELLKVADNSLIDEPGPHQFSFGAHNREFLKTREGGSMLVSQSLDPDADREDFKALGLKTYEPFSFTRVATFADGSTGRVGFDLTYTTDNALPGLAFFTCHNRYPETFWNKAFQSHENGAQQIKTIYIVSQTPAAHTEFLSGFVGVGATPKGAEDSVEITTPRGMIKVLTKEAAINELGEGAAPKDLSAPYIAGMEISCASDIMAKTIPAKDLNGLALRLL
ncbi:MAG: VOC family protein [Rhodobacteraceae bacterium]|nr:VOC family protein [Paracoccaceae bacterium]